MFKSYELLKMGKGCGLSHHYATQVTWPNCQKKSENTLMLVGLFTSNRQGQADSGAMPPVSGLNEGGGAQNEKSLKGLE